MRKTNALKVEHVKLTPYQNFAYKYLQKYGNTYAKSNPELAKNLEKGRVLVLPEAYAASAIMTCIIMFACLLVFGYLFIFGLYPSLIGSSDGIVWKIVIPFLFYLAPAIFPLIAFYVMLKSNPKSKVASRGTNIDLQLPYAVNFLAAMAATNATPEVIFRSLAGQKHIYGEICDEANWIYRDTKILGIDILKSLKNAIDRSPSKMFGEFIQGIMNALTSGRPLKGYLTDTATKYMESNRMEQQKFIETLGFLAESYVVVGVAFPIFFMVILVIMYWVSGSGMQVTDEMLYAVVFGMLGIINALYIFIVKIVTPEV